MFGKNRVKKDGEGKGEGGVGDDGGNGDGGGGRDGGMGDGVIR